MCVCLSAQICVTSANDRLHSILVLQILSVEFLHPVTFVNATCKLLIIGRQDHFVLIVLSTLHIQQEISLRKIFCEN